MMGLSALGVRVPNFLLPPLVLLKLLIRCVGWLALLPGSRRIGRVTAPRKHRKDNYERKESCLGESSAVGSVAAHPTIGRYCKHLSD